MWTTRRLSGYWSQSNGQYFKSEGISDRGDPFSYHVLRLVEIRDPRIYMTILQIFSMVHSEQNEKLKNSV